VETTALHTVATLLAKAAAARMESRGCHRRSDAPGARDEWQVRLVHRLDETGRVHTRTEPVRTLATAGAA
jgi:L-aspartate oxidase